MANKIYRSGMKPKGGGPPVQSTTIQGRPSAKQGGKVHATKNRSVNHGRRAR